MKLEVNVNSTELTIRLLKTTREKRAGDGMLANGEDCALPTARADDMLWSHDTVCFFGDLEGMIDLSGIESDQDRSHNED